MTADKQHGDALGVGVHGWCRGQTVLRNLMHWHIEGKEMALKDVPTMAILKEWRAMATGPKGRGPHRPANPPK